MHMHPNSHLPSVRLFDCTGTQPPGAADFHRNLNAYGEEVEAIADASLDGVLHAMQMADAEDSQREVRQIFEQLVRNGRAIGQALSEMDLVRVCLPQEASKEALPLPVPGVQCLTLDTFAIRALHRNSIARA
jgi:hypothetical protein